MGISASTEAGAAWKQPNAGSLRSWTGVIGWTLLGCWILLFAYALFFGERPSTLAQLEAEVSSGEVHTIDLAGDFPVERGFSTVEVHWRSGSFAYATQVVEATPRQAGRRAAEADGVTGLIGGSLVAHLQRLQPDLEVDRVPRATVASTDVLGWHLTGWTVLALLGLYLATLALLIAGPEPRRATRWAWFWLLSSAMAPLVAVAYLVVGGPISGRSPRYQPRYQERRLTGGWAFLLATAITAAFTSRR